MGSMRSLVLALILIATPPAVAQSAARFAGAAEQAARAAGSERMPRNLVLRLELLSQLARNDKANLQQTLGFFSQTRRMVWEGSPGPATAAAMLPLEQAAVEFARSRSVSLDLPPVGSSPAAGAVAPPEPRYTREGLLAAARQADDQAQSLWNAVRNSPQAPANADARARQDLVGVAETIHALRVALEEGSPASARFNSLATNRARLLFSHSRLAGGDPVLSRARELLRQLDVVVAAFRQVGS